MFLIESVMFLLKAEFTIIVCIKCSYLSRCENIDVYNEEMCAVTVDSLDINRVHGEMDLVHFVGTPFSIMCIHISFYMYINSQFLKRNKSLKTST